jgi:hypothetical protein
MAQRQHSCNMTEWHMRHRKTGLAQVQEIRMLYGRYVVNDVLRLHIVEQ